MFRTVALIFFLGVWSVPLTAGELPSYAINAGDILQVSVWKEPDLQLDVLVRPDGGFSLPMIGEVEAAGKTVEALREEITKRIGAYVPDAVVTVAVKQLSGDKVYVLGKVNRPGEYAVNRYVDVMQALSMARGGTPYADLNDIHILRRVHGELTAIPFDYGQVARGRRLEQNSFLHSGDTIVVP